MIFIKRNKELAILILLLLLPFLFGLFSYNVQATDGSTFHERDSYVLWGGGNTEKAYGASYDGNGTMYIVGSTNTYGSGGYDAFILKYDLISDLVASYETWGTGSNEDGTAIALDQNGEYIYIAVDNYVVKYDSDLNEVCSRSFPVSEIYTIDVDDNSNIVLAGKDNDDLRIFKIDSSKNDIWNKTHTLWAEGSIDHDGASLEIIGTDIYIITTEDNQINYYSSYWATVGNVIFIKYNSTGDQIFYKTVESGSGGSMSGHPGYSSYLGVDIDIYGPNEIYYVMCEHLYWDEPEDHDDTMYNKVDSNGNIIVSESSISNMFSNPWAGTTYDDFGPYEEDEVPHGITVDDNNTYIIGKYVYTEHPYGPFLWERNQQTGSTNTLFFTDESEEFARDVVVCDENVYVIGSCIQGTTEQALIVEYTYIQETTSEIPGFNLIFLICSIGIATIIMLFWNIKRYK